MRRLARRLFTFCSAVSLLLCVGVCVLWARSLDVQDGLGRRTYLPPERGVLRCRETSVYTQLGGVWIEEVWETCDSTTAIWTPVIADWSGEPGWYDASGVVDHHALGSRSDLTFQMCGNSRPVESGWGNTNRGWAAVRVPFWPVVLATAIPPLAWAGGALRHRARRRACCCRSCGYDLRASPERCPECGNQRRETPWSEVGSWAESRR